MSAKHSHTRVTMAIPKSMEIPEKLKLMPVLKGIPWKYQRNQKPRKKQEKCMEMPKKPKNMEIQWKQKTW